MNIGLVYNVRHVKPDINNPQYVKEAEFDEPKTIAGMVKALESLGHRVYKVEANENAYLKLKKLSKKIDLVLNTSEGMYGADRESQIPAMLEMLQIPYTGPRPLGYSLGLNKSVAKEILSFYKIPTPKWMTVNQIFDLEKKPFKYFPAIAKPIGEGSSKGIKAENLVNNYSQLKKIVEKLLREFKQSVIIEEYLPGREFTVGILGEKVLPIIEVMFDKLPKNVPKFDHYEAKWVYDNPQAKYDALECPAKLTPQLKNKIANLALKSFQALGMADWARIDIRLNKKGEPSFIEVNCPPGIIPDPKENSRFPRSARVMGLDYASMIEEILKSACRRYKITYKSTRKKTEAEKELQKQKIQFEKQFKK